MASSSFEPNVTVRFDVKSGAASDALGSRFVLVPARALESVASLAPELLEKLGVETGRACGARVAEHLGGAPGVRSASFEAVVARLALELGLAGIGAIHVERWGRAMVMVVSNPVVTSDRFVASAISGALTAATGRELALARLDRLKTSMHFFVGSKETACKVQGLTDQGRSWGEILASLHESSAG